MKIKNFIADNISDAMFQVKEALGADAIILSSQNIEGKIHLTAALDEDTDFEFKEDETTQIIDTKAYFDETALREALRYHGSLDLVEQHILASCREVMRSSSIKNDMDILAAALKKLYRFTPLLRFDHRVQMFMGTPGSGKSTAIAKVATQAKLKGIKSVIVSTDNIRAGANKQLEAFANILNTDFVFFKEAKELYHFLQNSKNYELVLIDTPGINPFISKEAEKVAPFADCAKCAKILTLDAGRNVYEAVEGAEVFADFGVRYLLPTRLDLTRRIGSILSVIDCCGFSLCAASVSSSIASGVVGVDSTSLAKLILG